MLSLKEKRRSAVSIAAEIEEVGGQPVSAQTICCTLHQIGVHGCHPSLFWRRYTRKPPNSLLKTCQQSTWITETMSYGLMRWKLICLVPMASSMCGGDQLRSIKISVSCLQSSMVVGISWLGAAWVLQVLVSYISLGEIWTPTCTENTAAEHHPVPPETVLQSSVPAWQWPQTHLQDDHCFTEKAEGKGDGLAKHVSRLEPNRTSSGRWKCAKSQISASSATSSWRSGRAFQWLPVKLW